MMRGRPDAFMMTADPLLMLHIRRVIDFLTDNRLPSIFQNRDNVVAGGLMSYGASLPDLFRRGAGYVQPPIMACAIGAAARPARRGIRAGRLSFDDDLLSL
jgi:hypothetical protein